MRWIKYKLDESMEKAMSYSDANIAIVEKEAMNGEYVIEDDGIEEVYEPTTTERIEALEAAMLDVILGG